MSIAQCMASSLTRGALTESEAEILELLASGAYNKSIARQLDIAAGTAKAHVKSIMRKLEATSRTQAVTVAAQRGLVAMPALAASLDARGVSPSPLREVHAERHATYA
jgi:DNA-binding NarL/FixJ family response regulator